MSDHDRPDDIRQLAHAEHAELLAARDERDRLRTELAAEREAHHKAIRSAKSMADVIDNHCIAMQSAVIDAHLRAPAEGMKWISNTLRGPGLLPDLDEAEALGSAQAWFDAKSAESSAASAAKGWCSRCGCGNDKLGYAHLSYCKADGSPA